MKVFGRLLFLSLVAVGYGQLCLNGDPATANPNDCNKYDCNGTPGTCQIDQFFDSTDCSAFTNYQTSSADYNKCFCQSKQDKYGLYVEKVNNGYNYCSTTESKSEPCAATSTLAECKCIRADGNYRDSYKVRGFEKGSSLECIHSNGFLNVGRKEVCTGDLVFSGETQTCGEECFRNSKNPDDCGTYFKCQGGIKGNEQSHCERGKHFSESHGSCTDPTIARCKASANCKQNTYEYWPHPCTSNKFLFVTVQQCDGNKFWNDERKQCV